MDSKKKVGIAWGETHGGLGRVLMVFGRTHYYLTGTSRGRDARRRALQLAKSYDIPFLGKVRKTWVW